MRSHLLATFLNSSLALGGIALGGCTFHGAARPATYARPASFGEGAANDESAAPRREAPRAEKSAATRSEAAPSGGGWPAATNSPAQETEAMAPREDRPGLGTEWGESRASHVREVTFARADEHPFAIATVYYNDDEGTSAMASSAQRAGARVDPALPMRGGLTISVVDETGAALDSLSLGGRVYVIGEAGRRYSLVVHNRTGRRYEVVASVDGLDVIDGQAASVAKRGYVIDPWGSLTIDGFRKSQEEVAAFRFGSVAGSYAARTGSDRDVGVIGVALFAERGSSPWSDDELDRRRGARPFSDARYARPPL